MVGGRYWNLSPRPTGPSQFMIRHRPARLIDAIWQRFAEEIAGMITCAKCPAPKCGRWFLRSAGRSDRQYCSHACQMRRQRAAPPRGCEVSEPAAALPPLRSPLAATHSITFCWNRRGIDQHGWLSRLPSNFHQKRWLESRSQLLWWRSDWHNLVDDCRNAFPVRPRLETSKRGRRTQRHLERSCHRRSGRVHQSNHSRALSISI